MVKAMRGGEALERRLQEVLKRVSGTPELRAGFLEGATYPGGPVTNQAGVTRESSPVSVATVAAAQEFGTDSIPSRPFFRTMVKEKKAEWGPALGKLLKETDFDVDLSLSRVGEGVKGQLQQSIIDTNDPPLAEATVAAKGFDKPLIDTSHMLNSVDYEVAKGS